MKNRVLLLVIVCLIIIGASSYYVSVRQNNIGLQATGILAEKAIAISVPTELAIINSSTPQRSSSTIQVRLTRQKPVGKINKLYVSTGDYVKKGDVLFKIDTKLAQTRVDDAQARYDLANATIYKLTGNRKDLTSKESELKTTEEDLKNKKAQAKLQFEKNSSAAKNQIDQLKAKLREIDLNLAQVNIGLKELGTARTKALNILNQAATLSDNDPRKQQMIKQAQGALAAISKREKELPQAKNQLTSARNQISSGISQISKGLAAGTAKFNQGMQQIDQAFVKLEEGRTKIKEGVVTLSNRIVILQKRRDQARVGLKIAKRVLEKTSVKAGRAGLVRDIKIAEESLVFPGQKVMSIVDADELKVSVHIPFQDISKLKDKRARIVIDAYPNKAFSGSIQTIGAEAIFAPSDMTSSELEIVRVVKVVVNVRNEDSILKAGIPADITFD